MRHLFHIPLVLGLLALAGCGSTPPSSINDVCSVFAQRDGFFDDWYDDAKRAERKYGIPVHVLMATMRVESGFDGDARPPRRKFLGIVPGKRPSSAFGYSQALDGTWSQYRRETGRTMARRTDFGDSVDFVGWYYSKTVQQYGISRDDAYSLYLSYRSGWAGYGRGAWRNQSGAQATATKAANIANTYAFQLRNCR
ncbi:transglycosylase SLT domain-containing protein [Acuticoccus sp. I52.16.1]|uniref:transglycosylase SLT domain-containing protein n=1 Tax=Acuticoccus sp. I52.16.1 TaxID=2928472 RepID=UPI001FD10840|nr:transglycosylase SLT domain-containing protein [Acuticoccus sp. I52.16.1]UOM33544.1 transglycosylase SLT domain-containing protein [Acuticoccus sp. I52.16.1]